MADSKVTTLPKTAAALSTGTLDAVEKGRYYLALIQWVESARRCLADVDHARAIDPKVEEALRSYGFLPALEWDLEVSEGLTFIHADLSLIMRQVLADDTLRPRQ